MAWGRYNVRVRAIYHGLESEISEFLIVVHAPWYATIWAFICYLLIALAALWYYLRNRKTKEQTRLRVQQFIHSAQLNEAKIQALEEKEAKHASANSIVAEKTETLQLKSPDEKLLERVMAVINKNREDMELVDGQLWDAINSEISRANAEEERIECQIIDNPADPLNEETETATGEDVFGVKSYILHATGGMTLYSKCGTNDIPVRLFSVVLIKLYPESSKPFIIYKIS